MKTIEIPPLRWVSALDDFTARHEGQRVSLDVLDPAIGAQPEINDLPLFGVSADCGTSAGAIIISAGQSTAGYIAHTIPAPSRLYVERQDDGTDVALQVESSDGTRAVLRLESPASSDVRAR